MSLMGRFGLVAPLFAVFVTRVVDGGDVEVVGIATTIYLLTKSLAQLPASSLLDRIRGERDDFMALIIGGSVNSLMILLYCLVSSPWELYLVQFFFGLASAFSYPAWMAIFTRHIDSKHEGAEWGTYFTLGDLAQAAAAALGGFIVYRYGFFPLFVVAAALQMMSVLAALPLRRIIANKR
jgi:MFS family permease